MKFNFGKKLSGLVALVMCFSMLMTACNDGDNSTKTTTTKAAETTTTTTSSENNDANVNENGYEKIFTAVDDSKLKLNDLEFEVFDSSKPYNNKAIYESGLNEDATIDIALVDFEKGEIKYKTLQTDYTAEECYYYFLMTDWGFALVDNARAIITTYDFDFNVVEEKKISENLGYSENVSGENCVLFRNYGENDVTLATINSQNKVEVKEYTIDCESPDRLSLEKFTTDNNVLGVYYSENYETNTYLLFDLENSKTETLNVDGNCNMAETKDAYISVDSSVSEMTIYPKGDTNIHKNFSYKSSAGFFDVDDAQAFFQWDNYDYSADSDQNSVGLIVYSLDDGKITGEITAYVSEYGYFNWVTAFGDKFLVTVTCDSVMQTYIWTPEAVEQTENTCGGLLGENYNAENEEIIERIKEKYGINVFVKSDAVKYFYGYAVVPENNANRINNALVEIEKFLQKTPEGLTQEMVEGGYYNGFNVYLTGRIVPDTEGDSINNAAAFATIKDNSHCIVVDITMWDIGKTFSHEFMHCMENAISSFNVYKDRDLESFYRWNYLNPDDFSYAYGYTDGDGNTLDGEKYQQYLGSMFFNGDDMSNIYFVDGYSTNYQTEDMARIFENLATYTTDSLPDYFKGENMQLKSAYLCACIREAFDCITDETVLFWEQSLNPEYDLEYFDNLFGAKNTNGVG